MAYKYRDFYLAKDTLKEVCMKKLALFLTAFMLAASSVMAEEAAQMQQVNVDDSYLTNVNVQKYTDTPIQEVNITKSFLVRVTVKVVKDGEGKEVQK